MILGRWRLFAAAGCRAHATHGRVAARARKGTITGRVTAQTAGNRFAEARIIVIGTSVAATSGDDGRFTLRNVPAGSAQLQVLRVGYQSQKKTVTVTAGANGDGGFRARRRRRAARARSSRPRRASSARSNSATPSRRLATSASGRETPIVECQRSDSSQRRQASSCCPASTLGGAPTVRVRGVSSISLSNAPIWVVDGVRYRDRQRARPARTRRSRCSTRLNPDEIEDIEIVKGPSAATLYGTDAANGVIVITTKKGRAGAARWTCSAKAGTSTIATIPGHVRELGPHAPSRAQRLAVSSRRWHLRRSVTDG